MAEHETPRPDADASAPRSDGSLKKAAEDLVAMVEAGAREPSNFFASGAITLLCLCWSGFQLFLAYQPIDSHIARAWHLAFAISLAFLAYPAYKQHSPPMWVAWTQKVLPNFARRSIRTYIPYYDMVLAALATAGALYIWWDYDQLINRQGLPNTMDIWMGIILVVLLLEAARRSLGPALTILGSVFLAYTILGPYLPEVLRHRGVPLDFIVSDMYLTTTGIFGVPLGVSTDFVFLFVLFGALLDRAGGGKYFIDVAFSALGTFRGGPAKAAVLASGLTGLVSGSSIANTVTTGTFTIPLMKKVGFPAYKAAAVEVAASTNGQLMPPVMGAAAFIMAEIIGIPYLDVVRAAFLPAIISYLALFWVVHIEAMKMGIKAIPRAELPHFGRTVVRGCHFIIPLAVLIFYLVVLRRSPVTSALLAIESLAVIMIVQRPVIAWLTMQAHRRAGTLNPEVEMPGFLAKAAWQGVLDIWNGLIMGARNMISVGVATATAGIIVGVVTITGLVGRFITLIDTISMGNGFLMLIFTAVTSLRLVMGMPPTANYIITSLVVAPAVFLVVKGSELYGVPVPGFSTPVALLAAHFFVFYFGILADVTPPVALASYAGSALAKGDFWKTALNGVKYASAGYVGPYVYFLHPQLFLVTVGDWSLLSVAYILFCIAGALVAMFLLATALTGWCDGRLRRVVRGILLACSLSIVVTMHPVAVVAGGAAALLLRRYSRHFIRILY
jgi:TRAP transporter 4TM/12TM fusion protein